MENYKVTRRLGEGAHGYVLKAIHLPTEKEVAIKKLLQRANYHRDNNLLCNLREIETMQQVDHEHIVELFDIIQIPTGIGLVMEYMPTNLNAILYDPECKLPPELVKAYFMMLLLGLEYLHKKFIMHRDLKPANLLISMKGVLKIADFGLARVFSKTDRLYSHQVATRWYRAPELLWGARDYTEAIDIWSVGCILGEMMMRSPMFPGISDIDQLSIVIRTLGTPSLVKWPEIVTLPDFNKITFPDSQGTSWNDMIPNASPDLLEIISKLLEYNPKERPTATQCLSHSYLWTNPLPLQLNELPSPLKANKNIKEKTICEELEDLILD